MVCLRHPAPPPLPRNPMRPTHSLAAVLGSLILALPGTAVAAPLLADTTTLLGPAAAGSTTPLLSPADHSDLGKQSSASADGRYVAFSSTADALSTENDDS